LFQNLLERIQSAYYIASTLPFGNSKLAADYHLIETLPIVLARALPTKEMMKPV